MTRLAALLAFVVEQLYDAETNALAVLCAVFLVIWFVWPWFS
jgi:hypothetical protein